MRLNDWGTAAELTAANPAVPVGEIYVERDTGRAKRGTNGTTRWNDLTYWDPEDNDGVSTATALAGKWDAPTPVEVAESGADAAALWTALAALGLIVEPEA